MHILVEKKETEPLIAANLFYQLGSGILTVIFDERKEAKEAKDYFTTLLMDYWEVDVTSSGSPLRMEVILPRKKWIINNELQVPKTFLQAKILFDTNQVTELEGSYFTNNKKNILYIKFLENKEETIRIADNVFIEVSSSNKLSGILFNDIKNDFLYLRWFLAVRRFYRKSK